MPSTSTTATAALGPRSRSGPRENDENHSGPLLRSTAPQHGDKHNDEAHPQQQTQHARIPLQSINQNKLQSPATAHQNDKESAREPCFRHNPAPAPQPKRSLRPRTENGQAVTASSSSPTRPVLVAQQPSQAPSLDSVRIHIVSTLDGAHVTMSITRPGMQGQVGVPTSVLVHALRLAYQSIVSSASNVASQVPEQVLPPIGAGLAAFTSSIAASSQPPPHLKASAVVGPRSGALDRTYAPPSNGSASAQQQSSSGSRDRLGRSLSFHELAHLARDSAQARAAASSRKRSRTDADQRQQGRPSFSPAHAAPTIASDRHERPRASSSTAASPQEDAALAAALHQRLSSAGFAGMNVVERETLLISTILAQHRIATDRIAAVEAERTQLIERLNAERAQHAQAVATWSETRHHLNNELSEARSEHERTRFELAQLRSHFYSQGVDPSSLGGVRQTVVDAQTSPVGSASFDTLILSSGGGGGQRSRADSAASGALALSNGPARMPTSQPDYVQPDYQLEVARACTWSESDFQRGTTSAASASTVAMTSAPWPFALQPAPGPSTGGGGSVSIDVMEMAPDLTSAMPQMTQDAHLRLSFGSSATMPTLVSSPMGLLTPSNGVSSSSTDAAFASAVSHNALSSSSSNDGTDMPPPPVPH